jgi:hypothetical protein
MREFPSHRERAEYVRSELRDQVGRWLDERGEKKSRNVIGKSGTTKIDWGMI